MCSNLAVILMRGLQKIQSDTRGNPLYQETPEHWMRACAKTRGIPWPLASSINRKQNVLYLGVRKGLEDAGFDLNFLFHWPVGPVGRVIPAHQWSTEDFTDPKLRSLLRENVSLAPTNVQQITLAYFITLVKVK